MTRRFCGVAAFLLLLALPTLAFAADAAQGANSLSINLTGNGLFSDRIVQIVALITVLSLAPSILIMMTSFVRIVVVLSLLRTALGVALNPVIGYEKGARIAKRAYAENRPVLEVALEDSGLDEATLRRLLDPAKLTRGGIG